LYPEDFKHVMEDNKILLSILSPIRGRLKFYAKSMDILAVFTIKNLLIFQICPLLFMFSVFSSNKPKSDLNSPEKINENNIKFRKFINGKKLLSFNDVYNRFDNSLKEIIQILEKSPELKKYNKVIRLVGPKTNFSLLASFFNYSWMSKNLKYFSFRNTDFQQTAQNLLFDEEYYKIKQIILKLYSYLKSNPQIEFEDMTFVLEYLENTARSISSQIYCNFFDIEYIFNLYLSQNIIKNDLHEICHMK
ncbi:hypothetical protein EDEG_04019, partial [Edhazardia aedis USNM 41457]